MPQTDELIGRVTAAIASNSTRIQEEGRALQAKLDALGEKIEASSENLTTSLSELTGAICTHSQGSKTHSRIMLFLTGALVAATIVMAWAPYPCC